MNILTSLRRATALWPDKEALVDGGKRFTYRQFGDRVNRLAGALKSAGVVRGTSVAIIAPNGHEYMETYYGCALAGAVLVPINYRLSAREVSAICEDAGVVAAICHRQHAELARETALQCPRLTSILFCGDAPAGDLEAARSYESALDAAASEPFQSDEPAPDDLLHLYYTSGTTGRPKGVMLTHGNVSYHAMAACADLGFSDRDTWLHAAPMFHLADAWATFAITLAGGKHVFVPAFQPADVLSTIEKERVSATVLVPTMITALLNQSDVSAYDYSSLRLIMTGGAPIAPETVRRIIDSFSCDYSQLYGMTETSPILTLSLLKSHMRLWDDEHALAVKCRTGRPFIGAEVRVVRADGSDVEPDDREVGEIIARGPSVTPGYWKQPEATARTIKDGWIHTGDLAVIDGEGYIKIVDRAKDMIITGGENVFSTEVEHVLYEHPAVLECAVFGVPDDTWGEAVKATVVLRAGRSASEADLIDFVRSRLARYKAPRSIDFVPELPKTGSGKIYKKGLRDRYWAGRELKV